MHTNARTGSDLAKTTRTVRFHSFGEPSEVLQLEETAMPVPGPGRILVRVHACGLNPADWALCRGLFPGKLPRGIGLDISGTIEAVGEGVTDVTIGEQVFGTADYAGCEIAGASDYAIMNNWAVVPPGLDLTEAAALPMAVETAFRSLEGLGVAAGHTVLINGGGTMMGFAAVQIALMRGAKVIATAGETFAPRLRALGATVTTYGAGLVARVKEITNTPPDLILNTAPACGILPELVKIAGGDPSRVLTITDFAEAKELGLRDSFAQGITLRYEILADYAKLAAEGRFTIPIARTFALADWRQAMDLSIGGHAHGKLMLVP